ncbi:hypothetical protein D3C81_1901450 [compost metagenome]
MGPGEVQQEDDLAAELRNRAQGASLGLVGERMQGVHHTYACIAIITDQFQMLQALLRFGQHPLCIDHELMKAVCKRFVIQHARAPERCAILQHDR